MKQHIRNFIASHFSSAYVMYSATRMLFFNDESYLRQNGWLRSLRTGYPVDLNGNPAPWMNYSAVELISSRLNSTLTMFEYGSGQSTQYFSKLCKSIVSVEYDQDWFNHLDGRLPANTRLIFASSENSTDYVRTIGTTQQRFDVVLIDGRHRVECAENSADFLTDKGVIILDDSHRERYAGAFDIMANRGFKALTVTGLKPNGIKKASTTIFYRDSNCFNL